MLSATEKDLIALLCEFLGNRSSALEEPGMTEIKGEPTDRECSEVDAKLLSPGWINLLDAAGLSYRERQVIGWALRVAPRLRPAKDRVP